MRKIRYYYPCSGRIAEIDVFKGLLEGLVLVDFEFEKPEEKKAFKMPDFCLVDVTREKLVAGGMLCGKSYSDIGKELEKFNYKKLTMRLSYAANLILVAIYIFEIAIKN